jgi:hypothetical protein
MSQAEVQSLSDEDLKKEWEQIKIAYQMGLQKHLSYQQGNILFANFVNVSTELDKRKIVK